MFTIISSFALSRCSLITVPAENTLLREFDFFVEWADCSKHQTDKGILPMPIDKCNYQR